MGLNGVNGAQWGSMGLNWAQLGSMGLNGAQWGSMGLNGAQWGSMGLIILSKIGEEKCFFCLCSDLEPKSPLLLVNNY